jgi:sugar phosphate isomerase/epimerase
MSIELGIATAAVPRDPAALDDRFSAWARGLGVRALGTHLGPLDALEGGQAGEVRARLDDAGLRIVQATGYNPNMVQPDPDERRDALARLTRAFAVAAELSSPMVISGCGTLHPTRFYGPHPENHAPQTRERLVSFLREAAPRAQDAGVVLALEAHLLTTLENAPVIRDILAAVDSPWVRVNFDPVNLLGSVDAVFNAGPELERMFAELEPYYHTTAHAKDVVVGDDLVLHLDEAVCGTGVFDFTTFLRVASRLGSPATVLVEHFPADVAPRALDFLRGVAAQAGVEVVA